MSRAGSQTIELRPPPSLHPIEADRLPGFARWGRPGEIGGPMRASGPRRVAIFTETFLPRVDGIVNTLSWMLRGLIEAGCEPLVIAPAGNTVAMPGVRVIGASSVPFPLYPEVRLGLIGPGICRELNAFEPELVHLAGPIVNGLGGLLYAQARQLPIVASYHTDLPRYASRYALGWLEDAIWRALRAVHNRCAFTLCPSHAVIDDLRRHGFERLRYWSRGVDGRMFSPLHWSAEWRERLGGRQDAPLMLYVGRLAREKRVDLLAALPRACPGATLAIVGDGPARAELEGLFGDLPVTFTGYLRGADLAAAYASADLFVFPSDSEAFGNVVLEAMASGLPVVAAAAGGLLEMVEPESTGLLFTPGRTDELIQQVRRYLDDARLRHRHGLAARAAAMGRTWDRQQQLLVAHYASAVRAVGPLVA